MKDDPVGAFEVDGGGFDPADALIHLPYCYGRKKKKKSTQQAILKLKILLLSFSVFRLRSKKRHTGTEKCGDILNTMKPHCKQTTLLRKMKKQSNAYAVNRKKKIRWKQRQKKKSVECEKKKKEQAWKTATLDIIAGVVAITSGNTQTITEKQSNYTCTNREDGASRIASPF